MTLIFLNNIFGQIVNARLIKIISKKIIMILNDFFKYIFKNILGIFPQKQSQK
jgi:hypothetical protein